MQQFFQFLSRLARPINIIYAVVILLFIADCQPWFDIVWQPLKGFVYAAILFSIPVVLVVNWKLYSNYLVAFIIVAGSIVLLISSPMILLDIAFSSDAWGMYAVEYVDKNSPGHTIERQVQDVGALGYNNRVVEVYHKNPFFIIVGETLPDTSDHSIWIPVNL